MASEVDGGTGAGARARALLDDVAERRTRDPESARRLALRARVDARSAGDPTLEAEALVELASTAEAAGDVAGCIDFAAAAAATAHRPGASGILARAEHLLAVVQLRAGNHEEALAHAERALDASRAGASADARSSNPRSEPAILNTAAAAHHGRGDRSRAIDTYLAAVRAAEPVGRHEVAALAHGNLARLLAADGAGAAALEHARQAVAAAAEHAPHLAPGLLADLAERHAEVAELETARACIDEARRVVELLGAAGPTDEAMLSVRLAEARIETGAAGAGGAAPASLVGLLDDARAHAEGIGRTDTVVELDGLLAEMYERAERPLDAMAARVRHAEGVRALEGRAAELRLAALRAEHAAVVAHQRAAIFRLRGADAPAPVLADDAAQLDAFERLAILAEFRDADTGEHTRRVGDLAAEIAHAAGEHPEWCERLRLAGRLHDIGKVAVPDAVLSKSGPLTVEEFELMKTHTTVGHQILAGSSSQLFSLAAELALSHHEWWDGHGYPYGRSGREIPLSGRIVALADVYDALCSRRPYKRPWPRAEAARFVASGRGAQFDPDLVDAFVQVLVARHPELAAELA